MLFKLFIIQSSGGPDVQRSGTFCAVLVDDITGNSHVKLFQIWTSSSGDDLIYIFKRTTGQRPITIAELKKSDEACFTTEAPISFYRIMYKLIYFIARKL